MDPFRERRSKQNFERRQQERLLAQQALQAQGAQPSNPSSSSGDSIDWSNQLNNSGNSSHSPSSASYHPPSSASSPSEAGSQSFEYTSDASDPNPAPLDILLQRQFKNTRRVDLDTLEALGVREDFVRLTERIGFTPAFWGIDHPCYDELTLEFLSSLKLRRDSRDRPYITFRMRDERRSVSIARLRSWFGFQSHPTTSSFSFRVGYDKDHFWRLISGMATAHSNKYRSLAIPHPVLRCIQRALANTIFARGETVSRVNEEDLWLMDYMLRPETELERPDLMLLMVIHWVDVRDNKKIGGTIHIGAYVTLIADRLGVSTEGLTLSPGRILMDAMAYQSATFLKIERGPANHRDRYFWRLQSGSQHLMPIHAPLSFDEASWLYTGAPPVVGQDPPPHSPPGQPQPQTSGDVLMPDAPLSPPLFHPPTSGAGPSSLPTGPSTSTADPSHPPDPTMRDLYGLISAMQATQLDILSSQSHIQATLLEQADDLSDMRMDLSLQSSRIRTIEDQMQAWHFYVAHGHWPPPPPPPQ